MATQGAQPYLLPLLNQLQGVEETLTNFIVETVLKLQSLTETKVFLLLDASGGKKRRFCGAPELINSFKRQELSYAAQTDVQVALDPNASSLVETETCDDPMFSETHEEDYTNQPHPENELLTFEMPNSQSSSPTWKDKRMKSQKSRKPAKKTKVCHPSSVVAMIDNGLKREAAEEDVTDNDFNDHDSESFDYNADCKQSGSSFTSRNENLKTPDNAAENEVQNEDFDPSPYSGNSAKTEEFKVIVTGRGCRQLLTGDGWRYTVNRGPCGPKHRVYYSCILRGCPARAVTLEDPNTDEVKLVYHAQPQKPHNHAPNRAQNDAKELLSIYRDMARRNPLQRASLAFEEAVAEKGSMGVDPSLDLDEITFKKHQNMFYRVKKKCRPKKDDDDSNDQGELEQLVPPCENQPETEKVEDSLAVDPTSFMTL